jgi:uncharacterized protein (TIGR02266 family)
MEFTAKRRHRRVPLSVPVHLTTIDAETDPRTGRPYFRDCRERSANLSAGGMFIATPEAPSPGRRLLVRIHVPDAAAPIEAVARVAWRQLGADEPEPGVGIEFLTQSADVHAAIERLLRGGALRGRPARPG